MLLVKFRCNAGSLLLARLLSGATTCQGPPGSGGEGVNKSKAPVNGVQLHYEVQGRGPHAVVCIPGALGTAQSDFKPQLEYFGREGSGYTVVAFDPRGYGLSRPLERFKKSSNFFLHDAKDAHALMQHLSLPTYSVLGWSDGGIAGLILAAMFPDSVRNLVAIGANAFVAEEDITLYEKTRDISTWSGKMREPLLKIYGNSLQELWSKWMDTITKFCEEHDGDICKSELSKIASPTLIVHGAKDPLVPLFHPEFLRDHVAGSRLEVFEEGKHNLHLRFHQEFNKMVDQFLQNGR